MYTKSNEVIRHTTSPQALSVSCYTKALAHASHLSLPKADTLALTPPKTSTYHIRLYASPPFRGAQISRPASKAGCCLARVLAFPSLSGAHTNGLLMWLALPLI